MYSLQPRTEANVLSCREGTRRGRVASERCVTGEQDGETSEL